jgi:hypothetical protein
MKKALVIMLLAYFSVILTPPWVDAGWLVYRKPEFKGKVIEAASREPIKGAVVVAMYYSAPILTGPGGGSPYIIHVKETLTDENGMFLIPSYTTLIQPNSLEDRAEFIIYKPGYGKLPSSKVIPDVHYIDPEEYFSKPLGKEGEMHWESGSQSRVIPVTYGIVELPKLETKEERLRAAPSTRLGELRQEDIPLLYNAINEDRKRFGLGSIGRVEE